MYFDAAILLVMKFSILFRLALAILLLPKQIRDFLQSPVIDYFRFGKFLGNAIGTSLVFSPVILDQNVRSFRQILKTKKRIYIMDT